MQETNLNKIEILRGLDKIEASEIFDNNVSIMSYEDDILISGANLSGISLLFPEEMKVTFDNCNLHNCFIIADDVRIRRCVFNEVFINSEYIALMRCVVQNSDISSLLIHVSESKITETKFFSEKTATVSSEFSLVQFESDTYASKSKLSKIKVIDEYKLYHDGTCQISIIK